MGGLGVSVLVDRRLCLEFLKVLEMKCFDLGWQIGENGGMINVVHLRVGECS